MKFTFSGVCGLVLAVPIWIASSSSELSYTKLKTASVRGVSR